MSMMSSAKRRWFKNFPFTFFPISFQSNFLKTLSRLVVNNLGEMVSPCLTPLQILNLSVLLCSFTHDVAFLYTYRMVLVYLESTLASSKPSNIDHVSTESNAFS